MRIKQTFSGVKRQKIILIIKRMLLCNVELQTTESTLNRLRRGMYFFLYLCTFHSMN